VSARAEAGEAFDHYSERFKAIFADAGAGVAQAGEKVAGAAERMADWLKSRSTAEESRS
jgi:hypothetical protein